MAGYCAPRESSLTARPVTVTRPVRVRDGAGRQRYLARAIAPSNPVRRGCQPQPQRPLHVDPDRQRAEHECAARPPEPVVRTADAIGFDIYNLTQEPLAEAYATTVGKPLAFPEFGNVVAPNTTTDAAALRSPSPSSPT